MPSDSGVAPAARTVEDYARRVERVHAYLAGHLDRDVDLDHLAGIACFSPFHFHRIYHALQGETVAESVRRMRLHRAALDLIDGALPIARIAARAGYGSQAAFTRAFRRAYGHAPSAWRSEPGPVHLPAPNRIHFHPPGGLRLPATQEVTSMDLVVTMTEHHIWLVSEMLARAERLPDDVLDAPVEISVDGIDDDPTLRSLLARLVGQLAMWDAATRDEPYDFAVERDQSVTDLRAGRRGRDADRGKGRKNKGQKGNFHLHVSRTGLARILQQDDEG